MNKVRIKLRHPGLFGAFGYHRVAELSPAQRRGALKRAAKALGWRYVIRRLNVLYIYNKHRHPDVAALFKADREYASAQLAQSKL